MATPHERVTVVFYTRESLERQQAAGEVELDTEANRTGDVWHCALDGEALQRAGFLYYAYRCETDAPEDLLPPPPPPPAPPAAAEAAPAGPLAAAKAAVASVAAPPPPPPPEPEDRWAGPQIVIDPYATGVATSNRPTFGVPATLEQGECWPQMASVLPAGCASVPLPAEFDWQGTTPPRHAMEDTVIYEAHVRGLTQHESSGVGEAARGKFAGVVAKLPYLKELGITALELLPVNEFNEVERYDLVDPQDNTPSAPVRLNFWGYSTLSFMAPMARYASEAHMALYEFKEMVRECHRNGIEVILDVVFNHTGEGNEMGPTVSFRGLDERAYYVMAPAGEHYNYSGCGNTFNCNHPVTREFIRDCLRFWAVECRVDGFRFDLASILTRASERWGEASAFGEGGRFGGDGQCADTGEVGVAPGHPLDCPPLIEAISRDPALAHTKLFAEPWDAGGLYQVGSFPFGYRWSEWNGKFRDDVRRFLLQPAGGGQAGDFASRICGSPDIYQQSGRNATASVNFVTCHDGFGVADLTAFNERRNMANGENNNDGEEHNLGWNCGQEGATQDPEVHKLRARQRRNLIVALLLARGVPMLTMGDEYAHSKQGNNNTYCWDSELNWLRWDEVQADSPRGEDARSLVRFVAGMVAFRKRKDCLRGTNFAGNDGIEWHGINPGEPNWADDSEVLAFRMPDQGGDVYACFNSGGYAIWAGLPQLPSEWRWVMAADTAAESPCDVLCEPTMEGTPMANIGGALLSEEGKVRVSAHSCVVLEAVRPHHANAGANEAYV